MTDKKTIVVTGASRGLGLALVHRAVALGWNVVACSRGRPTDLPAGVNHVPLDLASESSVLAAAAEILTIAPSIDVVVNNAALNNNSAEVGGGQRQGSASTLPFEGMSTFFTVNATAPIVFAGKLLTALKASERGLVINVSSIRGSIAEISDEKIRYGYGASKAALNHLTRTLAFECKPSGIRVVAVHPGWMRTDLGGPSAPLDPSTIANALLALHATLPTETSGGFIDHEGRSLRW